MEITRRSYPVQVFTATHQAEGLYQPIGNMMTIVNDQEVICFELRDATLTPLAAGAALRPIAVPRLVVNKKDILFVAMMDDTLRKELNMLRRVERIIAYLPSFVLRGEFHLGAEQQLSDMLDTLPGVFQPITAATLFPLIETPVRVQRDHDLVVLNTRAIQFYHAEAR